MTKAQALAYNHSALQSAVREYLTAKAHLNAPRSYFSVGYRLNDCRKARKELIKVVRSLESLLGVKNIGVF